MCQSFLSKEETMPHFKSLTQNGLNAPLVVFILSSLAMLGVSIYLIHHFYATLYPTTLGGASGFCNLSSFFNCDTATNSKFSNILGVPISFFGVGTSSFFLLASFFPSESLEKTCRFLATINFIGCLILLIISLVALKSLCPFCSVYYLLSTLVFILFLKYSAATFQPNFKILALWSVALLSGAVIFFNITKTKEEAKLKINSSVVEQYRNLPFLGDPQDFPYKIHQSSNAPLRLTMFSDFQCPYCKVVAEQMSELIDLYKDKITVQYMFYPLDNKCNPKVKRSFHEHACQAAFIAACDEKKFLAVHDEIFASQSTISSETLDKIAKKHNLVNCNTKEISDKISFSMKEAEKFNLRSTPTIILNGKKIEGTIPTAQFRAIFDDILASKK